jgi:arylsulfatase A-like enzyme
MNINIYTLINHPLTMVVLGSTLGWLFVSYVWMPYNTKKIAQNKANKFKIEVFLRLIELKTSFENQYSTTIITNLLEGKTTLNPDYKYWKLNALIYNGWSEYVHHNTNEILLKLATLVEEDDTIIDYEMSKKGTLLVETLSIYLENIKEK